MWGAAKNVWHEFILASQGESGFSLAAPYFWEIYIILFPQVLLFKQVSTLIFIISFHNKNFSV